MGNKLDWNARVHMMPTPVAVATLMRTHGTNAVVERWGWLAPRTLGQLLAQGRRELRGDGERTAA